MDWKEFTEKYHHFSEEFNEQTFDERCRTSRLMAYEAIRELIRSKKHLNDAIDKINERIKILAKDLEHNNHSTSNPKP